MVKVGIAMENNQEIKLKKGNCFWKKVLDSHVLISLLSVFLVVLTLFLLTKISFLFEPLGIALKIIAPPFIIAFLFYYLLEPIVRWLTEHNISRKLAIFLVFFVIILLLVWAINYLVPLIQTQIENFVRNIPYYVEMALRQLENRLQIDVLSEAIERLQTTNLFSRLTESVSNLFTITLGSIGNFINVVTTTMITLITAPFVLYYMLADGDKFKPALMKAVPVKMRSGVEHFLYAADSQVGSYVRGQLLVALGVAILFYIGYTIIDLDYALLLAVSAGILNMVPYLGSIASAVPALIIGAFVSPMKFLQVALVLMTEQTIEGRLLSPLILGNTMEIHPLMILFILLIAGGIFGVAGVLLAVPGYAIIRILVVMLFDWIKNHTSWYDESVSE